MKEFLDFLERHKQFIKRLIIFIVVYTLMSIFNNPNVEYFLNMFFGEYISTALHALIPTYLIVMEV